MAKLKAIFAVENLKKFFLKHGEKLVLGFVCLFALSALMGTTWVGYGRPPLELVQNLEQAKRRIDSRQLARRRTAEISASGSGTKCQHHVGGYVRQALCF